MPLFNNQHAKVPGEFLGKDYDFFTLTSVKAEANLLTQAVLDRVIEVIAINGQPVLLGSVVDGSNQTLRFAIEHTGAWTTASLQTALATHGTIPTVANFANASVALSTGL